MESIKLEELLRQLIVTYDKKIAAYKLTKLNFYVALINIWRLRKARKRAFQLLGMLEVGCDPFYLTPKNEKNNQ